jgi:S1-C subfamily serine protease
LFSCQIFTLIQLNQNIRVTLTAFATLVLLAGCRSRLPQALETSRSTSACSNIDLAPEALFEGAKPGVAVVRSGSMEGSAFVVRQTASSTFLLTNSHVLGQSRRITVKWSDGSQILGVVVSNAGGETPLTDLALIEVQGIRGRTLVLKGQSPSVGASIVAIGSPKGLEYSLTRGVVSSLRENGKLLQIDAPINPGNSGGPVLDKSGCVVGVATFKLDESEGLNFAISSSLIEEFLRDAQSFQSKIGQPITQSPTSPVSPFSKIPSSPRPAPAYGSPQSANCWFQASPGSQQLSASLCRINSRRASQGRIAFELIDAGGVKRVLYLRSDKTAEVYMGGQRQDGTWLEDPDGDLRIYIQPGVFAFTPPT